MPCGVGPPLHLSASRRPGARRERAHGGPLEADHRDGDGGDPRRGAAARVGRRDGAPAFAGAPVRVTRGAWLWAGAALLTLAAAAWQRRTGPTYPYRTALGDGGDPATVSLPRSHVTTSGARIAIPARDTGTGGVVWWRRYPTAEPFAAVPLQRVGGELVAALPAQPPSGKVEYYLELGTAAGAARIPREPAATVVLRYHGPIPPVILVPHVAVMFLAILVGARAGLGAWVEGRAPRLLTLATLGLLTVGGLVLGPMMQHAAFGPAWTGVPVGWDLTDNKTLVMWLGWAVAAAAVLRRARTARLGVIVAAALMLAVYVVPHSAAGSQLDYGRLPAQDQAS
jgi:hypothetical protein